MTAPWNRGRGTVAVAARYSYTGALFSLLSADSTLRYGDYQLRVDHPLAGGQATVFAFGRSTSSGGEPQRSRIRLAAVPPNGLALATSAGGRTPARRGHRRRRLVALDAVRPADPRARALGRAAAPLRSPAGYRRRPARRRRDRAGFRRRRPRLRAPPERPRPSPPALTVGGLRDADPPRRPAPEHLARDSRRLLRRAGRAPPGAAAAGRAFQATERSPSGRGGRFAQMPSLPVSVAGFEAFGLADLGLQTSLAGLGFEARLPRSFTVTSPATRPATATDRRARHRPDVDRSGAPDFLVSRRGRAYGAELLLRRADSAASSAGWRTRCRGAGGKTTAACSDRRTGISATS